jgi:glycine/D-amino acid oxidase-like deaminating enzyme
MRMLTWQIVPCTRLIITAGAWSPKVFSSLFPASPINLPITPLAGHSLVLRSPRWTEEQEGKGCHAVFVIDSKQGYAPEMASRIGGEIFLGGLNSSSIPLPTLPTEAKIQGDSIAQLKETAADLFGSPGGVDDLEIVREALVSSCGSTIMLGFANILSVSGL